MGTTRSQNEFARLQRISAEGLRERYSGDLIEAAETRCNQELDIIRRAGLVTDFLALAEVRQFARDQGVPWNLIGASCSSLVGYCLGLSGVDPLCRGLLFERFCDPHRKWLPVFVIQVPPENKQLVRGFATERRHPDDLLDRVSFSDMPELATFPFRVAARIEQGENRPFDLLDIPAKTSMGHDDPTTFEQIMTGDSSVVALLGPSAINDRHLELGLSSVEDLAAIEAIATMGMDGPDWIKEFIGCSGDPEFSSVNDAGVAQILSASRGLLLYQEQAMLLLEHLGGLTLSEAYLLVRNAAKRHQATVEGNRERFVRHAEVTLGPRAGNRLFDRLIEAAPYVCCKSHYMANAMTTYQAAYLQTHFPDEFAEVVESVLHGTRSF